MKGFRAIKVEHLPHNQNSVGDIKNSKFTRVRMTKALLSKAYLYTKLKKRAVCNVKMFINEG